MIEPCITNDAVILNLDADLIMQQIEILFDTSPGEVLGSSNFGLELNEYLHNINVGNKTVAEYIKNKILNYVELFGWNVNVEVEFLVGEMNDIMMIFVQISNTTDNFVRVFRMSQGRISPIDYSLS